MKLLGLALLSLVAVAVAAPPASAGPGLGGGYERSYRASRKRMRRLRHHRADLVPARLAEPV